MDVCVVESELYIYIYMCIKHICKSMCAAGVFHSSVKHFPTQISPKQLVLPLKCHKSFSFNLINAALKYSSI